MIFHLFNQRTDSGVTLAPGRLQAVPGNDRVQVRELLFLFAAKPALDRVESVGEHALISLLDARLCEVIIYLLACSGLISGIRLLLGVCDLAGALEVRNELRSRDLSALVLVHHGEELLDALQVFLHEALLELADHFFELLEADLAAFVCITGTEELCRRHVPTVEQVYELLEGKRFKLYIAFPARPRSDEVLLSAEIVGLQRMLILRVGDPFICAVLVEDVLESARLRRRESQLEEEQRLAERVEGDLACVRLVTDPKEGLRGHLLGLETRYKFCHHGSLRVVFLRLPTFGNRRLASFDEPWKGHVLHVALLGVALDLDNLRHDARDVLVLCLRRIRQVRGRCGLRRLFFHFEKD